jgi:hypothetical protein
MKRFELPTAPASQTGQVKAWSKPVIIPTYHALPPDKNPMFLDKRIYRGSSGRVYPLPFLDRISTEGREHMWQAVHLENEFLRVMVLPEIGGRIHVGVDKTNGYDFCYRKNVIKPGLVGLAGPWISGGTINLVFTAIALGLGDRFGPRALMLFGCAAIRLLPCSGLPTAPALRVSRSCSSRCARSLVTRYLSRS